jgi:hypothetical protein
MIFQLHFPTVSAHVKDGIVTAAAPLTAPFGIDSDVSGSADDQHMGTVVVLFIALFTESNFLSLTLHSH